MHPSKLTHTALVAAVVGAALAFAASGVSAAEGDAKVGKDKCFGIAKVGENSCASVSGSHSCAGQSKVAFSGQEFKEVPVGTCDKMMGSMKPFDGVNPKIKG